MDKDPKKHIEGLSWEEILKLVEQLQDDQSELEAQNSELRRTLKNKDRSLKNYADHYDFAPVGYLSLSSDGLILAVNLAGCQLLGEERSNLFHRPVADFLDPGSEEAFRNHLQRVFYTEESDVCQVKVHYKTGSYDIELRSAVVRDSETDAPYCRSSMYNITGRLKMEAELDEQRRLTGAVFEHIESGIIVCNREGKVTLLNKAASNLFRHDLTGFRCQDWHSHLRLFREEEQVPLNEEAEAIFHGWKGERFENVEVNYVPGEGRVHTLLASGQSISQPQGLNLGAIIVLHDITDRKRAEDELRYYQDQLEKLVEERTQDLKSANNRLAEEIAERSRLQNKLVMEKNFAESLINSQPGLFYLMNKKGEMLRWNKNMELYTGYSRNEIKEMQALNLLTEEDVNLTRQMLDETLQYRKGFGKARLATKNGKKISFLLTGVAIEHDGEDYIIGTGIDISELERERKEKMRFFQVLEKSMNEIYIFDAETLNLIYVNAGARVNLGYSAEELMKMKAYDIKPEFTEAKLREVLKPLANGEREKIMLQTAHQRNDGSVYQAEVNMQLIEQEQERVFIAIARDITDRLEAEEQIKKTLHEKEILLGEIHHRVKNNLSVISSLLSMQASYVEDKNVHDLFKECETRIKSMGLIHEMLYQQENFSHINFDPYIKSLVEHIASNFKSEEVLVQTRVEVDDLSLDINTAIPCALVINELLTNAFKHAFKNREKGTITVSLNADDDHHVRLVVKDDGVGLPEDIEGNRLYETLGMSLVSGLTAQLKGQLSIKRTGGTAFIVVFPYQAET